MKSTSAAPKRLPRPGTRGAAAKACPDSATGSTRCGPCSRNVGATKVPEPRRRSRNPSAARLPSPVPRSSATHPDRRQGPGWPAGGLLRKATRQESRRAAGPRTGGTAAPGCHGRSQSASEGRRIFAWPCPPVERLAPAHLGRWRQALKRRAGPSAPPHGPSRSRPSAPCRNAPHRPAAARPGRSRCRLRPE